MFQLDQRLAQDTIALGEFELSLVLLSKDANYPWLILVPKRESIHDIHQLSPKDQSLLIQESSYTSQTMADVFQANSMNVAALGNIVEQLHVHHVARFTHDLAWPGPIWGAAQPAPYTHTQLHDRITLIKNHFTSDTFIAHVQKA